MSIFSIFPHKLKMSCRQEKRVRVWEVRERARKPNQPFPQNSGLQNALWVGHIRRASSQVYQLWLQGSCGCVYQNFVMFKAPPDNVWPTVRMFTERVFKEETKKTLETQHTRDSRGKLNSEERQVCEGCEVQAHVTARAPVSFFHCLHRRQPSVQRLHLFPSWSVPRNDLMRLTNVSEILYNNEQFNQMSDVAFNTS